MMKWLKSRWTMKFRGFAFTDVVSGKHVYYYKDCFGDWWMSDTHRFGFRVKATKPESG